MKKTTQSKEDESTSPAQVQTYLIDADYPLTKADLISLAKEANAPKAVIKALEEIEDRQYADPTQVSKTLTKSGVQM